MSNVSDLQVQKYVVVVIVVVIVVIVVVVCPSDLAVCHIQW